MVCGGVRVVWCCVSDVQSSVVVLGWCGTVWVMCRAVWWC